MGSWEPTKVLLRIGHPRVPDLSRPYLWPGLLLKQASGISNDANSLARVSGMDGKLPSLTIKTLLLGTCRGLTGLQSYLER
jgi:hypothetical protein